MRFLVISDVHARAAALESVLKHAAGQGWDEAVFLGDAVGYGEDAAQVIGILRGLPLRAAIRGNHEDMLFELRETGAVRATGDVVRSLERNLEQLSESDLEFLAALPESHRDDGWTAVHGAPRNPAEYLISVPAVRANGRYMLERVCFNGHTHVPAAYLEAAPERWKVRPFRGSAGSVDVPAGTRAFLNPGSVSLPRDGLPSGSYGIFDEEQGRFSMHRIDTLP